MSKIKQIQQEQKAKKKKISFKPPIRGIKSIEYVRQNEFKLRCMIILCSVTFAFEYELFNQFFKRNAPTIVPHNSLVYIDSNVSLYSQLLQGLLFSIPFGYLRDFLSQSFTYYFAMFIMLIQNVFKLIFLSIPNYHYYILNLYLYGISNGVFSINATILLMRFTVSSKNLFLTFVINMICQMLLPKIIIFFFIQQAEWYYGYEIICSLFFTQCMVLYFLIPRIIKIYQSGKRIERQEDPSYDELWRVSYHKAPLKKVIATFFNKGSKRVLVLFFFLSIQLAFCQDQIYAGVKFFYSDNPSEYNGTHVSEVDVQNNKNTFLQSSIIYMVSMVGLLLCFFTGIYMDKCKSYMKNIKYIVFFNGLSISTSFLILNCINHTNIFDLDYPNIDDIYNFPFFIVLFFQFLIGLGLGNCLLVAYYLVLYCCPFKVKGTFLGTFTFILSIIGCCQQTVVINLVEDIANYQFIAGFLLLFIAFLQLISMILYPPRIYKQFFSQEEQLKSKIIINASITTKATVPIQTELSYSIN